MSDYDEPATVSTKYAAVAAGAAKKYADGAGQAAKLAFNSADYAKESEINTLKQATEAKIAVEEVRALHKECKKLKKELEHEKKRRRGDIGDPENSECDEEEKDTQNNLSAGEWIAAAAVTAATAVVTPATATTATAGTGLGIVGGGTTFSTIISGGATIGSTAFAASPLGIASIVGVTLISGGIFAKLRG